MKKSTKLISVILALVMVLSVLPVFASAKVINSDVKTVETLISTTQLGNLAGNLLSSINARKNDITGTILRLVYLFLDDETLTAEINKIKGGDVTAFTDDEAAKVLLNWLDKNLPEWTSSISDWEYWDIVTRVAGLLRITLDLSSVNGIMKTLQSAIDKANDTGTFGTLSALDDKSLVAKSSGLIIVTKTPFQRSDGDLKVIYALLSFLNDNINVIKTALNGNISLGSLVEAFFKPDDINNMMKNIPFFLKSFLYKLIDSEAATGKFSKNADEAKGDWGKSAYDGYSADGLLGAALLKVIRGTDDVISKEDAQKPTTMSFYQLLAEYAPDLFNNYAISWLNENLPGLIEKVSALTAEIKARFVSPVPEITKDTFAEIFEGAKTTGFLGQFNAILAKCAQLILTPDAYNALKAEGFTEGGNENLNANLTALCRYVLPVMFDEKVEAALGEGYHFPDDLKANYKTASLADMVVAILKPLIVKNNWFGGAPDNAAVSSVKTPYQLGALALYLTATNPDWINLDYDFGKIKGQILDGTNVKDLDEAAATDAVKSTAAGMAIGALKYNGDKIHFNVTLDDSSWQNAFVQISNWALAFIKGMPMVAEEKYANLAAADGYGPFYKANVLLNELIDFSFLNDVNTVNFKLDLDTLLNKVISIVFNVDVEGLLNIFKKNDKEGNILNSALIPTVIGAVDRILTALFEHTTQTETADAFRYDKQSGYIIPFATHKITVTDGKAEPAEAAKNTVVTVTANPAPAGYAFEKWEGDGVTFADATKETTTFTMPDADVKIKAVYKQTVKLGDVDFDGNITAADARLALRRAVELETYAPGSPEFIACDVDKADGVTAADARLILRAAVELEDPTTW